jgi:hypothetical protein
MISLNKIETLVSDHFEIYDLKEVTRKRTVVFMRYVFFALSRNLTNFNLIEIGSQMNKDHATVINGLKKFENEYNQKHFVLYKEAYDYLSGVLEEAILKEREEQELVAEFVDKVQVDILKEIYNLSIEDIKDFEEVAKEFLDNRKKVFGLEVVF